MTNKKGEAPTALTVDASRPRNPDQETQPMHPVEFESTAFGFGGQKARAEGVDATLAPGADTRQQAHEAAQVLAAWFDQQTRNGLLEGLNARDAYLAGKHIATILAFTERAEDLAGALEDVLNAWDRYQQVLGDCEEKPIMDAEAELEAELEGARIVLQANAGGSR